MQKSLDFWVGLRYNGTVKKRQSEYTYEKGFSQWLYIRGAKTKKEKECIAFLFFFGVGTERREPENPTRACDLLDTPPPCGYNNTVKVTVP